MVRQIGLLVVAVGLVSGTTGCVGILWHSPLNPRMHCDPDHCCDAPAACADCGGCGVAVGACCDTCGPCDIGCGQCVHPGPVTWVFRLLNRGVFCDGCGCGERYWGEWYNDPVDCCDPCDQCGNFTGGSCATCSASPHAVPGPVVARQTAPRPVVSGNVVRTKPTPAAPRVSEPQVISETERVVSTSVGEEYIVEGSERIVPGSDRVVGVSDEPVSRAAASTARRVTTSAGWVQR
ncbi:MAG: hypothetical protein ACOY3P_18180 [Planctomycetota bacterium]